MPYLVESVLAAVRRAGGEARRVIHPIVVVERTPDGELQAVLPDADPAAPPPGAIAESWIHVDLGGAAPSGLHADVAGVLHDVREVVRDAPAMARQARALADRLLADGLLDADRSADASQITRADDVANLLRWLADGHFTFLGHRYLAADGNRLTPEGPGLGVLRSDSDVAVTLTPERVDTRAELLVLTRASAKSRVLRPVQPYYLAVRVIDAAGRLLGEHRFLGMLTVAALYENVLDIPVVERHVRGAIQRAGFPLASYSGQQMLEVISALPREELFSGTEQQLHDTAVGVLAVAGRRAVRVFLRPDPYHRFVSCLVYVPRDRYTTSSRIAMAEVLRRHLRGTSVDFTVRLTESALALVHFTVHTDPADTDPDDTDRPRAGGRRGPPGRARRGRPHLGRPPAVAARQRRGGRPAARGPRGVQGGRRPRTGTGRPALRRRPERRRRLRAAALRPVRGPGGALHALPRRCTGDPDGRAAGAAAARRGRPRRAPLGDRPARRPALLDLRLRAEPGRRDPDRARRPAAHRGRGPVHRGVRGGVAGRGGDRPLQRARPAHRAHLA